MRRSLGRIIPERNAMLHRATWLLLVLSALGSEAASGQVDSAPQVPPPPSHRWHLAVGAHYSPVYVLAGHVAVFPKAREDHHGYSGLFFSVEPGVDGGLVGIGIGSDSPFILAFLRAAFLRTWGDPGEVAANQTFVGLDLRLGVRHVSGGVGWYPRIQGSAPGDGDVWLLNIGIGF